MAKDETVVECPGKCSNNHPVCVICHAVLDFNDGKKRIVKIIIDEAL